MPLTAEDQLLIELWAAQHDIMIEDIVRQRIEAYHDLIISWSHKMNLVSRGDMNRIIENHFVDSLSPLEIIPENCQILDIGSGSGFPAIPLAIFRPGSQFTLIESVHKKALFLRMVIAKLNLDNIKLIEGRLEEIEPLAEFDIITIRALPRWENFLENIKKFLNAHGKIIYYDKRGTYQKISKE